MQFRKTLKFCGGRTGAMYGTGTIRRQADAKADAVKRKRDAGPDMM